MMLEKRPDRLVRAHRTAAIWLSVRIRGRTRMANGLMMDKKFDASCELTRLYHKV